MPGEVPVETRETPVPFVRVAPSATRVGGHDRWSWEMEPIDAMKARLATKAIPNGVKLPRQEVDPPDPRP